MANNPKIPKPIGKILAAMAPRFMSVFCPACMMSSSSNIMAKTVLDYVDLQIFRYRPDNEISSVDFLTMREKP